MELKRRSGIARREQNDGLGRVLQRSNEEF